MTLERCLDILPSQGHASSEPEQPQGKTGRLADPAIHRRPEVLVKWRRSLTVESMVTLK